MILYKHLKDHIKKKLTKRQESLLELINKFYKGTVSYSMCSDQWRFYKSTEGNENEKSGNHVFQSSTVLVRVSVAVKRHIRKNI